MTETAIDWAHAPRTPKEKPARRSSSLGQSQGILVVLFFLSIAALFGRLIIDGLAHWMSVPKQPMDSVSGQFMQLAIVGSLQLVGGWALWRTQQSLALVQEQKDAAEESNRRLRASLAHIEDLAIEQERVRLAREIHDGLGHHLNNINIHVGVVIRVFESDRVMALDSLLTAKAEVQSAHRELRRAVEALVSDEKRSAPLHDALAGPVRDCALAGVAVDFHITGTPRLLPDQVRHVLYRIGQEALTNIRQHAHATWATLQLDYQAQLIRIVVADNGVGMPAVERRRGHGLDNLYERAALIGGTADIETCPGNGLRIVVEVPL